MKRLNRTRQQRDSDLKHRREKVLKRPVPSDLQMQEAKTFENPPLESRVAIISTHQMAGWIVGRKEKLFLLRLYQENITQMFFKFLT